MNLLQVRNSYKYKSKKKIYMIYGIILRQTDKYIDPQTPVEDLKY